MTAEAPLPAEVPRETALPGREGMSWSWDLDLDAVLSAVGTYDAGPEQDEDRVEAEFAEYLEAREAGRTEVIPLPTVSGRIAEALPVGPGLAAWLGVSGDATSDGTNLDEWALPGRAASYRRLAAWAQAGELTAVARLASRSAAADEKVGIDDDGRPAKVTADTRGQVSLALTLSQSGAAWWTDLAVTLQWRLSATGVALRAGQIDLARARTIADATSVLDEEKARAVEAKCLPKAGHQTIGQLRSALRRAVIAVDPQGAEQRREEAERRARVTLYPDEEGTASLAGYNLPGVRAAAAMARITALARAMKASGADGGLDLLRSKVLLGLLLGTLPYIPPPPAGPADADLPPDPDSPPAPDSPPDAEPPLDVEQPPDSEPPPDAEPPPHPESPPDPAPPSDPEQPSDAGPLFDEDPPPDADPPASDDRASDDRASDDRAPDDRAPDDCAPDDEVAWVRAMAWPRLTAFFPAAPGEMANLPPTEGGLLELRIPWSTLAEGSGEPGNLGRLGAITPSEARHLARLAAQDPTVQWRVIVTDGKGQAIAIARAGPTSGQSPGPADGQGSLLGRVTVTIRRDDLGSDLNSDLGSDQLPIPQPGDDEGDDPVFELLLGRILGVAAEAADRADARTAADAKAPGGCAHAGVTAAYRPPAWLREHIVFRDVTCRFPTCRQPAVRCDLDHTQPHDRGGSTCYCNLGALCRFHHQLKQHPRWTLDQAAPGGTFTWTTPAGRAYSTEPDSHAA